jgi:hypothetical protein
MTDQQMIDLLHDTARQYEQNYPKRAAEIRAIADRLKELAGI